MLKQIVLLKEYINYVYITIFTRKMFYWEWDEGDPVTSIKGGNYKKIYKT